MYRQLLRSTPKEALNWRLFYGVICFGLMGAARGKGPWRFPVLEIMSDNRKDLMRV